MDLYFSIEDFWGGLPYPSAPEAVAAATNRLLREVEGLMMERDEKEPLLVGRSQPDASTQPTEAKP
jgi:hypothetical protein